MEDFIEGFGITQHKLAVAIGVPPRRINEIIHGKRGITADTAMRLSRYFGTTPGFWMNLQMRYELDRAEDALGDTLSGIVPLRRWKSSESTRSDEAVAGSREGVARLCCWATRGVNRVVDHLGDRVWP